MSKKPAKKKTGPEADRVKLDARWEDAMKTALGKKRPAEGWPEAPKRYKKKPS